MLVEWRARNFPSPERPHWPTRRDVSICERAEVGSRAPTRPSRIQRGRPCLTASHSRLERKRTKHFSWGGQHPLYDPWAFYVPEGYQEVFSLDAPSVIEMWFWVKQLARRLLLPRPHPNVIGGPGGAGNTSRLLFGPIVATGHLPEGGGGAVGGRSDRTTWADCLRPLTARGRSCYPFGSHRWFGCSVAFSVGIGLLMGPGV